MYREVPPGVDAQAIVASLALFRANHQAIDDRWEELLAEHEGDWVVSHNGEFVFGATIEESRDAALARGWPLGEVAREHLLRERPRILLQVILGYFTERHVARTRPYVPAHPPVPMLNCRIWIPMRGNTSDSAAAADVKFLVDTGADMSVLHPRDSRYLFPGANDWDWLRHMPQTALGGAGGGHLHYEVPAYIFLEHTDASVDSVLVTLYVAEQHPDNTEIESLLGRDVLGHYQALFDQDRALTLERPAD